MDDEPPRTAEFDRWLASMAERANGGWCEPVWTGPSTLVDVTDYAALEARLGRKVLGDKLRATASEAPPQT